MQTVQLGRTRVSRLCFGTLTMGPLQCDMSPSAGASLLVEARRRGVDFLDTADIYGTYPHIALALREAPDLKICTKAYCYDAQTAGAALERAFRGLDREYVDIFMLHEQESIHTLRGHAEALDYLHEQQALGRVGALGVSTHHVACVRAAATFGGLDVIFPILNQSGVGIADGTRAEMEAAVHRAKEIGLGILAMKPYGGGHLIGDAAGAMRYALANPDCDAIAVGMQSLEEIEFNVALFEGREPDQALCQKLNRQPRRLLIHDWCEGCGRCVKRCNHDALRLVGGRAQVDERKCVRCGYCASVCPQFCIKVV